MLVFGPIWFVLIVITLYWVCGRKPKAERDAEAFFAARASASLIAAHQEAIKAAKTREAVQVYPKSRGTFAVIFGSLVLILVLVSVI